MSLPILVECPRYVRITHLSCFQKDSFQLADDDVQNGEYIGMLFASIDTDRKVFIH